MLYFLILYFLVLFSIFLKNLIYTAFIRVFYSSVKVQALLVYVAIGLTILCTLFLFKVCLGVYIVLFNNL